MVELAIDHTEASPLSMYGEDLPTDAKLKSLHWLTPNDTHAPLWMRRYASIGPVSRWERHRVRYIQCWILKQRLVWLWMSFSVGNSAHSGKTRDSTEGTEWLCNSRNSHRELLSLSVEEQLNWLNAFFLSIFYLFVLCFTGIFYRMSTTNIFLTFLII